MTALSAALHRRRTWGVLLVLALSAAALFIATQAGAIDVAGPDFEIDGNTPDDAASPLYTDWSALSYPPAILIEDPHSKTNPNMDMDWFAKGGKFDDPAGWTIQMATGPAQNELTNIFAHAINPGSDGNSWLVLGMERTKKSGTFDLDFELNQVPWSVTPPATGGPTRTEGDLVVGFELKGNPTDPQADLQVVVLSFDPDDNLGNVCVNTFTGPKLTSVSAVLETNAAAEPCLDYGTSGWKYRFLNFANAAADFDEDGNNDLVATMNSVAFTPIIFQSFDEQGNPRTEVGPFEFAEAALNLTALGVEPTCGGFGSVHAKSRSSLEPGSDLKDLAGPETFPVTCGLSGLKYNDLNTNGDQDTGEPELSGWEIHLIGTAGQALIDGVHAHTTTDSNGEYSFSNLVDGTYVVCETVQADWVQSEPSGNTLCEDNGHTGAGYEVTIDVTNQQEDDLDFGNYLQADIRATKTGVLEYTAAVHNDGPASAADVDLDDDLPGDLSWGFVPGQANAASCTINASNHLHCDVGTLADGASFSIVVEADIDDNDCDLSGDALVSNTATGSSSTPDPSSANDSETVIICDVAP